MDTELQTLESKVAQLIDANRLMRTENAQLCAQLAQAKAEYQEAMAKIDQVKARLEKLLEKLPEEQQDEPTSEKLIT